MILIFEWLVGKNQEVKSNTDIRFRPHDAALAYLFYRNS